MVDFLIVTSDFQRDQKVSHCKKWAQIQMDDKPFERDPASAEDGEVPNGPWDQRGMIGLNINWQKNCDGEKRFVFFSVQNQIFLMYVRLLYWMVLPQFFLVRC